MDKLEQINSYKNWLDQEGIPVIRDWYIDDVRSIPVHPWKRTGGLGAYLDLVGSEDRTGAYVCEIPPRGSLNPEKHLFEELIYIVSGRGTASVWAEDDNKQTFTWQEGSLFSPPLNMWHQLFNAGDDEPARFFAVTGAPVFMNLFHNARFIFNNDFVFHDRYDRQIEYFSEEGHLLELAGKPIWETNFIRDVRNFEVPSLGQAGAAPRIAGVELCQNTMETHIAEFGVGTYKRIHRHSGGAHIIILGGQGYSLTWPDGGSKQRFDWHEGSVLVPPEGWWHTHFNTGSEPARQLALRWDGRKYRFGRQWRWALDVKKGGDQIEFVDEDPEIRRLFKEELAKTGTPWRMAEFFPGE